MTELALLRALAQGYTLKSHRDLEGHKAYRLYAPHAAPPVTLDWELVAGLQDKGWIDSNKKFPAATYWLTERGLAVLNASATG